MKEFLTDKRVESVAWFLAAAGATAALLSVRGQIGSAHVALTYLMIVLGCSSRCGRYAGLLLAAFCFVAFNFFFVVPFGTLAVHDPYDWLILFAFLGASAIAAELLSRAQGEAEQARLRANEIQRLASLGAEALQAPRAKDALTAIARMISSELGVESEIFMRQGDFLRLLATSQDESAPPDAATQIPLSDVLVAGDSHMLTIPLAVQERQVGILRIRAVKVLAPKIADYSFVKALSYYAALGLERERLTADAAAADALKEADRLKDAVLSAVSHDLRTPLTSIKATAREISDSGDPRAAEIEMNADRLNRYVTNLLDLSALNAGNFRIVKEAVPIEDLIGAVLREVASLAKGRAIVPTVTDGPAILAADCDFVLTLRALSNVLINAIMYSPGSSTIDMAARQSGRLVEIAVSDRGEGICDEEVEQIFQPFQRGLTGRSKSGTGLGLATARRLLQAQGGGLTYAKRERGGSVFSILLPASHLPRESL